MSLPKHLNVSPNVNFARIAWDLKSRTGARFEQYDKYWAERQLECIPRELFQQPVPIWFEIGAGSGWFFVELARLNPDRFLIAIERSKMRGKRLVRKAKRSGLQNLAGFRGNAIPALIDGVPSESVDRIYLLYPCPWPKTSQRKNRWYLHPIMPHLSRILKKGGLIIWASDQRFYIEEAHFVCTKFYGLSPLVVGQVEPNAYNDLGNFPGGRTKFERSFLSQGQPCYELIVQKS